MTQDIPEKFLAWLRHTPIAPRKRKRENRPTSFDAGSVTAFFHWIGWKADERGLRSKTTVRKYWRYIAPFFELLDPHYRPERLMVAARENGKRMAAAMKAAQRLAALEGSGR